MNATEVAELYVSCGREIGFFCAEMILMKHLPANKPDGKCFDVPKKMRPEFIQDLQNAIEHGVEIVDGALCILDGKKQPAPDFYYAGEW